MINLINHTPPKLCLFLSPVFGDQTSEGRWWLQACECDYFFSQKIMINLVNCLALKLHGEVRGQSVVSNLHF